MKLKAINLGQVGHINVASGFGAFPEIYDYLISDNKPQPINFIDESQYFLDLQFKSRKLCLCQIKLYFCWPYWSAFSL